MPLDHIRSSPALASPGASLVLALLLALVPAAARAQTLAITGGTVIDGTGAAPVSNGVVVITDGRISAVGAAGDVDVPPGRP